MLGGLVRLILFRVLGARVMMALAAFGWLRRMLAGRRAAPRQATPRRAAPRQTRRSAGD